MFSDGPRLTDPKVCASPEFFGLVQSCTCVYAPNYILHCTAKYMVLPVIIAVGLSLPPTTELTGKLLIQNT